MEDLWKLGAAYGVILLGVVGDSRANRWHGCLCRGPDWLAKPAVELASPGKAAQMRHQPCALNGWMLSHFLSNAALAFVFPQFWWIILGIGTAWEFFEKVYDRFQPLDLMYNALGVVVGLWLRWLLAEVSAA